MKPQRSVYYWPDPNGSFSLLFYAAQDQLSRDGTTPSGLGPSTSVINHENALQTFVHADIFSTEFPLLVCVK